KKKKKKKKNKIHTHELKERRKTSHDKNCIKKRGSSDLFFLKIMPNPGSGDKKGGRITRAA
ncbi:hypothetical protein, partial [Escherichia coli]|uniref:hypothetical protein n=1 Tax=Escherichia coli TaxID=562 RepID=UPI001BB09775